MQGTILDRDLLVTALREHDVTGVIHVAGFKYAGVSVQRPLHTYEQNVEGTRIVLAAMADAGVHNIVFSSSAAVYGTPDVPLVTEDLPKRPASPYGESKLIGEWLLRAVPWLMRGLSVVGTLAMFLVGGGILAHGIAPLVRWLHDVELSWGGLLGSLTASLTNLLIGFAAGALVLGVVSVIQKMRGDKGNATRAA